MSVPVVGTVLLAILLYGDFGTERAHFRLGHIMTPSSQAATLHLPAYDTEDESSAADAHDDGI